MIIETNAIHWPAFVRWLTVNCHAWPYESIGIIYLNRGAIRKHYGADNIVVEVTSPIDAALSVICNFLRICVSLEASKRSCAAPVIESCDCTLLHGVIGVKNSFKVVLFQKPWALGKASATRSPDSITADACIRHSAKVVFYPSATPPAVNSGLIGIIAIINKVKRLSSILIFIIWIIVIVSFVA